MTNLRIFNFNADDPDFDETLAQCVDQLRRSQLVAMPTETVYGLAGDAASGPAVAKIFAMKARPKFNPLIAHVSGLAMAETIGEFDASSLVLAERFWPGPLTLAVKKKPLSKIHDLASSGLNTIAVRCPYSPARQLIEKFGGPLVAPSANISGRVSPTSAMHVTSEFSHEDIIVLDAGVCPVGIESTIVKAEKEKIIILRSGSICADELADCVKLPVEYGAANAGISAPGMMASHYAPRARVIIDCLHEADGAAMLAFGGDGFKGHLNLSLSGDLCEAASNLYQCIRKLDSLDMDEIRVAPIPRQGLGIAINDRLARAAAPRPPVDRGV